MFSFLIIENSFTVSMFSVMIIILNFEIFQTSCLIPETRDGVIQFCLTCSGNSNGEIFVTCKVGFHVIVGCLLPATHGDSI
jgi:hypothetical protein